MREARRLLQRLLAAHELAGTYDARRKELATVSRDARAYLDQPITKCEDLAAAICFLEHSKNTHENWAAWLADDKVASPDGGDLEHHRRCILEYGHILDVIQGSAREGELVAALEEFGAHKPECAVNRWVQGIIPAGHWRCGCGLRVAIEEEK